MGAGASWEEWLVLSPTCAPEVARFMQQLNFCACQQILLLKYPPEIQQLVSDSHMQAVYLTLSEGASRRKRISLKRREKKDLVSDLEGEKTLPAEACK